MGISARPSKGFSPALGADAGIGVGFLLSEDFEGERQQRVAGKECRPFVISLVHGWLTRRTSSSSIVGRSSCTSE